MEKYEKVGIDRIEFMKLGYIDADIPYLIAHRNVDIVDAAGMDGPIKKPDGTSIRKITVKDNEIFSTLVIGVCFYAENAHYVYTRLTLNVATCQGNNLVPFSHMEYDDYLHSVITYILHFYHINLDIKEIAVAEMEINCNLKLANAYESYRRCLRLLLANIPYLTKKFKESLAENKSRKLVFYDKRANLIREKKNFDRDTTPVLRTEICLKTNEVIQHELGTNIWHEMTDELILNWFQAYIEKNIIQKYEKWLQGQHKTLVHMAKEYIRKYPNAWHHKLMNRIRGEYEQNDIPFALDIEQIKSAVRDARKNDKNCKRKCGLLDAVRIGDDVYFNRDTEKMQEILDGYKAIFEHSRSIIEAAKSSEADRT